jgi:hypothetical protein
MAEFKKTPPAWDIVATDGTGKDRKVGGLWPTKSPDAFRGNLDLENTGAPIRVKLFRHKPKPVTHEAA